MWQSAQWILHKPHREEVNSRKAQRAQIKTKPDGAFVWSLMIRVLTVNMKTFITVSTIIRLSKTFLFSDRSWIIVLISCSWSLLSACYCWTCRFNPVSALSYKKQICKQHPGQVSNDSLDSAEVEFQTACFALLRLGNVEHMVTAVTQALQRNWPGARANLQAQTLKECGIIPELRDK